MSKLLLGFCPAKSMIMNTHYRRPPTTISDTIERYRLLVLRVVFYSLYKIDSGGNTNNSNQFLMTFIFILFMQPAQLIKIIASCFHITHRTKLTLTF